MYVRGYPELNIYQDWRESAYVVNSFVLNYLFRGAELLAACTQKVDTEYQQRLMTAIDRFFEFQNSSRENLTESIRANF